ncbi:DUF4384 domain-containing protein [Deinococcus radiodurans R1 = ATCC 13939 = DSM 20539]|uniref:S-layer-like array-related protein n=2 Tax=Deinococcus radiodurans TaxID=1299 RepID=Q9RVB4_DEIRA|nr:S-layer-like array-related protein [Deinococcus radiodurans R1 = ATCC 13939 = DSM 20539]QEM70600.1 DUF4384 domain-containing protein [Deinococcus radiodurans]UDL00251.1 DUF4384 domain-containing protein [Deinococcus radiodurans R1 = ATCC 13939 = DSM 20539]HCE64601.1 DUF4384 domain-containing protein [Deinococcus radiodurans]
MRGMNKTNKALTASLALGLGLTLSAAHASPSKITAQSIIVNPAPTELKVDVWTDKDATGNANPTYRIGDPISVGVKVNQDAYVYLFNVNADGAIDLFFPNGYEDSNFVKAGTARVFPRQGAKYALNIGGPAGQDKLLALASAKALSLDDIAKFAGDQGFAQVGIKGQQNLAKALSIIVNPLPANSWVTDVAFFRVNGTQASDPIKPAPNASIAPGERQDGSIDQAMADAYDRLKGQASLGDPTIYATRWADGWWQRFEGVGAYGDAVLLHANGSSRAYAVHGAIFKRYLDLARAENGVTRPPSRLGWAAGDEKVIPRNTYGTSGLYGFFQNGALYSTEKYGTFWLQGAVLKTYQGLGGSGSFLGFPLRDQYQVNGAWTADFEGGSIRTVNGVAKVYRK